CACVPAVLYACISSPCCFFVYFFFSSRRRHTRWPRDWSSDVCSSDLERLHGHRLFEGKVADVARRTVGGFARGEARIEGIGAVRSEERRVGKEGRARGAPDE